MLEDSRGGLRVLEGPRKRQPADAVSIFPRTALRMACRGRQRVEAGHNAMQSEAIQESISGVVYY